MKEFLAWWFVLAAIAVITFPFAFTFLRFLPDRGYSFARVLGLLLLAYLLWMGATLGLFPNSRGSVLLLLITLAAVALLVARRNREELAAFVLRRWRYILLVEGLFALTFAVALFLRSYVPELNGTEKPTEFAFLNAILRTHHFPAYDPWLSGHSLSYYYFGFVMADALIKLTAIPASIGFNLALALTAAFTVLAAFGVVYNLIAVRGSTQQALIYGGIGAVLVSLLSNLEGFFELLAAHNVGPQALYQWAGINGLQLPKDTSAWYPTEYFWWWRSTRIPSFWDIKEYPFFSFLLGDLHPHVMVLPFTLLAMGAAFNVLRMPERLNGRWMIDHPIPFLLLAIVLGSLSFLNAWSFPPTLLLLLLIVLIRNCWQASRINSTALADTTTFAVPFVVASVLLYLPFYLSARGALWPLAPVVAIATPDFLPRLHMITNPKHLFIVWAPLLWLGFGLALASLHWRRLASLGGLSWVSPLPAVVPLALWVLWVTKRMGLSGLREELAARDANLLTLALLAVLLTLITLAFVRLLAQRDEEGGEAHQFALAAIGVSVLMLLGVELFFMADHVYGSRENTVFKFYHHAWVFLGVGGAVSLHYILSRRILPLTIVSFSRSLWVSIAIILIAGGLVLPVTATFNRTGGFNNGQSLDGLAFVRNFDPAELEAAAWLNGNVAESPVILEAVGDPFTEAGRVSSRTGLPTVLEWPLHEIGYRGASARAPLDIRRADVERFYKTTSIDEAKSILAAYEVKYVYVGTVEKKQYGEAGLAKLGEFLEVVFQNRAVTIYRVPEVTAYP